MSPSFDFRDRFSGPPRHVTLDTESAELEAVLDWLRPYCVGGSLGFVAGCLVTVAIAHAWSLFL